MRCMSAHRCVPCWHLLPVRKRRLQLSFITYRLSRACSKPIPILRPTPAFTVPQLTPAATLKFTLGLAITWGLHISQLW